MFKKILYPTDFSDVSKKALEFIKGVKETGAEEVVVLHVVDMRNFTGPDVGSALDLAMQEKSMENRATREIEVVEKELTKRGFAVKTMVEDGIPFREILRIEKEEDVSITVIGSHWKAI